MEAKSILHPAATVVSAMLLLQPALAQDPNWYVTAGLGLSKPGSIAQSGNNTDNICYPTHACTQTPSGYRWYYDHDADRGPALELGVGRSWNDFRVELAASRLKNDLTQHFVGITYLDGVSVTPAMDSAYRETAETSVGALITSSLAINLYRDFPGTDRFTPYIGIGLGASHVNLTDVFFRGRYFCISESCRGRPEGEFDSWQNSDFSDFVFSRHAYAGLDYDLDSRFKLGLKLTYRQVDEMSDTGGYIQHPVPNQVNVNRLSDTNHWSLTLELKRYFAR